MKLIDKLKNIDKPSLHVLKDGHDDTIAEFWNNFILPLLPDKNVVIGIYEMLLKYIEEPEAVFAIRTFGSWSNGNHDNKELRRGFYNTTESGYSFFYTDNFFTAYFCKLAIDKYIPDYEEFKHAMISREFPARFGRHDSTYEKVKAAYSIDGKKGKDPLFTKNGYKIAHVVNTGRDFRINDKDITIKQICDIYYTRGDYDDWKLSKDIYGDLYVRHLGYIDPFAKEILKAHFLRFACPLNYILTPGQKHHTTITKVFNNDIAESPELQQYAMEQFRLIYGTIYDDYLSRIMLTPIIPIINPGKVYIGIKYGYNVRSGVTRSPIVNKPISNKVTSGSIVKVAGIGQYAKKIFTDLLVNGKLNNSQINDLKNKFFCSRTLGISYPVIVEVENNSYESVRYYKEIVLDKYVICSQWYSKNKSKIDDWLTKNNL